MQVVNGSLGNATFAALLKAIDLMGQASESCTCYRRLDLCDLEIGILPGNFSAKEVADLFKAAAYHPQEHPLPLAA